MNIVGIDHIQIAMPVGEEGAARRFYGELLGLREIPKPEPLAARGGCWFENDSVQIHLGVEADFSPAKKAHPAFLVTDLDALEERFKAAGLFISHDQAIIDKRRFHAFDPFGNRLEFIEQGDGFFKS